MKPLISIIIPCFNTAEYLPQCMASLEKQTIGFEKLQFIFVDDASTDEGKTWRCICEFEQRHPKEVVREFDTLKSKKVPQSLEIGLFFCQIFIFII